MTPTPNPVQTKRHAYFLEQLFLDQEPDLVVDTIAPLIAWVRQTKPGTNPPIVFSLLVERTVGVAATQESFEVGWSLDALRVHVPDIDVRATRMAAGRTALHEDIAKLAAYGLALAAISVLLPGVRIKNFNFYAAPDLVFDDAGGVLKGVEVAGRGSGGQGALRTARLGGRKPKQAQLLARADVIEAHLSLWCADPQVGLFAKVKP